MKDSLPPCSIDDVIVHHFNFEGLKKYIEYMDGNTWKALNQISEIKLKLLEIDEIKTSLSEVFTKLDSFSNKFNDLENTVSFQQMKIMDVEKKAQSHDDKIANVESSCSEAMKSVQLLEDNVHNLNRVTEDNCKSIDKLTLYHENIRKATEAHSVKLETHEKNLSLINSEIAKVAGIESTLSQHMIKTKQKIHKLKKRDNDQDNIMKTKFQEIDLNIIKLFSSVSDLSGNILPNQPETIVPKVTIGTSKKKEDDGYSGSSNKFNIDSFYKEYSDFRFKIEDEVKSLNNKIKLNNKSSNNLARQVAAENENMQHNNNMNISPDVLRTDINTSTNNLNQQYILSSINQLQENDKLVLQNLSYKVNREELEKLQRHMGQEIERAMVKVTETITKNDEKNKKLAETVITQNVDRTEIVNKV